MLDQKFFQKHCSVLLDYLNHSSSIAIVTITDDFAISDCNVFFKNLVGPDQELTGKNLKDFIRPEDINQQLSVPDEGCHSFRFNLLSTRKELSAMVGTLYRTDSGYILFGEKSWISDHKLLHQISRLNSELAKKTRELSKKNIALEKANSTISKLLKVDDLTGIATRRYFMEYYQKMHAQAIRHCLPLTLVMSDLDYFKAVNDNLGHQYGDMVLVEFARLLKDNCRAEDLAARFGGEEFVTLLIHTGLEAGFNQAERVRSRLERKKIGPREVSITASFGVAALKAGEEMGSLIKRADNALYEAKKSGRNTVCLTR